MSNPAIVAIQREDGPVYWNFVLNNGHVHGDDACAEILLKNYTTEEAVRSIIFTKEKGRILNLRATVAESDFCNDDSEDPDHKWAINNISNFMRAIRNCDVVPFPNGFQGTVMHVYVWEVAEKRWVAYTRRNTGLFGSFGKHTRKDLRRYISRSKKSWEKLKKELTS